MPRIQFGRVVNAAGGDANASLTQASDKTSGGGLSTGSEVDTEGFAYLKRDLVRLLGILCHENPIAQDRVRHYGGITVVMNLCVVDERNPCTYIPFLSASAAQLAQRDFIPFRLSLPSTPLLSVATHDAVSIPPPLLTVLLQ